MKNRLVLTFLMAYSLFSGVCFAGFNEGLDAAQRGDFATALKEWGPMAEQGDPGAMLNLGVLYQYGEGVPQNRVIAYTLFKRAAMFYSIGCELRKAQSRQHQEGSCNVNNFSKKRDEFEAQLTSLELNASRKLFDQIDAQNLLSVLEQYIRSER